jgi:hypothetical protein
MVGGADALKACLVLVQVRDNHLRRQWYKKIFDEALKGFPVLYRLQAKQF